MDLLNFILNQKKRSLSLFGEGRRTIGITEHIKKEIKEVIDSPDDLMEWIDIITLALDGAWRTGASPKDIEAALRSKQGINFLRKWPHKQRDDICSEHIKDEKNSKYLYPPYNGASI